MSGILDNRSKIYHSKFAERSDNVRKLTCSTTTYSAEKNSDAHDSAITDPVLSDGHPGARIIGNHAAQPELGDARETGNSVSGNAVATRTVTVATGNVTVATTPVCDVNTSVSVPDRDSEPSSPHPAIVPTVLLPSNGLARKEVISTLPPADGDISVSSSSGNVPMGADDHAGLATPMEVDNHASLDGPSPMEVDNHASLDGTPPIQSVDLDTVPAWLRSPLKHLRQKFQGEVEDKILGNFVALEMAWQPVRLQCFLNCVSSTNIS